MASLQLRHPGAHGSGGARSVRPPFKRFDVSQWLREKEKRLLQHEQRKRAQSSPGNRHQDPQNRASSRKHNRSRDFQQQRPQVDALVKSLDTISEKLQAMSHRVGVGSNRSRPRTAAGTTASTSNDADLQARDELILALHEVIKVQGQQLIVKEEELTDYFERLRRLKDEEDTIFALVDALEHTEADLRSAQQHAAKLDATCTGLRNHVACLEWQLRIAIPDPEMRKMVADQAQGRMLSTDDTKTIDAGAISQQDAEQRRIFLAAAQELEQFRQKNESSTASGPDSSASTTTDSKMQRPGLDPLAGVYALALSFVQ